MGFDPRQALAGFLTLTMFVMLGNMIKRDHFDSVQLKLPGTSDTSSEDLIDHSGGENGPWLENESELKSCWAAPSLENTEPSKGFLLFSLINGPEYHVSQIAVAVVVARYLGATLVLPDIRGVKPGDKRNFEDIYDVEKFVKSLDGVVKVAKDLPSEISLGNLAILRVPNRVSEDYIAENIEPVFRKKGNIRLVTYFNSIDMKRPQLKIKVDSVACLAMFGTLELQPEVRVVVDSMVDGLRSLSQKSDGKFISIDLTVDKLESKGCRSAETGQMKSCYSPQEIAIFLKKIGFDKDTVIYLTQSRWDRSLSNLKDFFPKLYTKEAIMPGDKKVKFLDSEAPELAEVIDFYICSESDAFVPAILGLFYANVAGRRVALGRTRILVPANIPASSAAARDFISPYISKRNHLAYLCYCEA